MNTSQAIFVNLATLGVFWRKKLSITRVCSAYILRTQGGEKLLRAADTYTEARFYAFHTAAPPIVYEERRACFCCGVIASWNLAPIFGRRSALERKISPTFFAWFFAPDEGFAIEDWQI